MENNNIPSQNRKEWSMPEIYILDRGGIELKANNTYFEHTVGHGTYKGIPTVHKPSRPSQFQYNTNGFISNYLS